MNEYVLVSMYKLKIANLFIPVYFLPKLIDLVPLKLHYAILIKTIHLYIIYNPFYLTRRFFFLDADNQCLQMDIHI